MSYRHVSSRDQYRGGIVSRHHSNPDPNRGTSGCRSQYEGWVKYSLHALARVQHCAADLFDLSQHVSTDSSLKAALEKNMFATQKIITNFMRLHPDTLKDLAYQRCQSSQTEVSAVTLPVPYLLT